MCDVVIKYKDRNGITYAHPERKCTDCKRYPCISNMKEMVCDFAKYGCVNYVEKPSGDQ